MTVELVSRRPVRAMRRKLTGRLFGLISIVATALGVVMLAVLLIDVFRDGAKEVDWDFLTSFPSRFPERAGIRSALLGTAWMLGFTAVIAIPIGVGAAIYLEEYAPDTWLTRAIQINIANLAGVPSVVYGLLGLGFFVRVMMLGRSILAGSLTMSLLILPLIIVASREAIRAVPGPCEKDRLLWALLDGKWFIERFFRPRCLGSSLEPYWLSRAP